MSPGGMSTHKQQLNWSHDERSIGIMEEDSDGNVKYIPIILYNFKVTGYVNEQFHPYRGWEIFIKTTDGHEFELVMPKEDMKTFKTFHRHVTEDTWGADLSYIPFDEALWSELFARVKFECRPIPMKKPRGVIAV